jgi:epoxide hydrolase-like predicted phosphatase
MNKYKNIIFDLGGVLVNWKPKEIIPDIFKNQECMPAELWESLIGSKIFKDLERGLLTRKQALKILPKKYDKKQFEHVLKNVHNYLFPLPEGLHIFNKVKEKKYNTYVLSNFQEEIFNKAKYQYDFLDKFDGVILSYKVKAMKPEPQIYQTLLDKYKLTPTESIFIDDLEENILGAKKFGIDGIVCKNHDHVVDELKKRNVL